MNKIFMSLGGLFGIFAVILGAMGSHLLKKILTEDQLHSFEVGVRYQMYHAILLIIIGIRFSFIRKMELTMGWLFVSGICFFSGSIYLLTLCNLEGPIEKIIGISTPIGGLFLIIAWLLLIINILIVKK